MQAGTPTTKQRMVEAAAESLRRRGLQGTSFTHVLERSGAARGAIYHHFPGGKAALAEAAVGWTGENVVAALTALPPAADPGAAVAAFLDLVRPVVAESATGAGCAVAAVTLESPGESPLQLAARDALRSWRGVLHEQLVAAGCEPRDADALATLLVTTLEGAHVLCRAEGSIDPFDDAASMLRSLTRG